MSTKYDCANAKLSYHIQRAIARYAPRWQADITRLVRERMSEGGGSLSAEDLSECAMTVILGGICDRDQHLERLCQRDYDAGHFRLLKDVINELRARTAKAN